MRLEMLTKNHTPIDNYELTEGDYFIYQDKYGRRWKLEPLKNINLQMPFRIVPLAKGSEK